MSQSDQPDTGGGVLSSLPSTRPQRRSAKRAPATTGSGAADRSPPRAQAQASPAARRPRAAASKAKTPARPRPASSSVGARGTPREPPPAAQGFAPDTSRGAVEPPSRADLLGSVGQSAGELVHVGLDIGRVLLRTLLRHR